MTTKLYLYFLYIFIFLSDSLSLICSFYTTKNENSRKNKWNINEFTNGCELETHRSFMQEALNEAKLGLKEGGYPIGSVLVINNKIVARGHNQFIQKGNPIIHAEIDAIQNSGILDNDVFKNSTLFTTLSPCHMCSGAILFFKIKRLVIGDNVNCNLGKLETNLLKSNGVEIVILNDVKCIKILRDFMKKYPDLWDDKKGACKSKKFKSKSSGWINSPTRICADFKIFGGNKHQK